VITITTTNHDTTDDITIANIIRTLIHVCQQNDHLIIITIDITIINVITITQDDKGNTLCKFVINIFWAAQFEAVREGFFGDLSNGERACGGVGVYVV
jgi:hypothetical protein